MGRPIARLIGSWAVLALISLPAFAQDDPDPNAGVSGEHDFNMYCASCHGEDATGNGPKSFGLSVKPPDLTTLTMRYGSFPAERIARVVDGRESLAGHQDREMPVWGTLFKMEASGDLGQAQGDEQSVNRRIGGIIDYMASFQK